MGHAPSGAKWEFDSEVAECFEDMLRRSIPQYDVMRDAVFSLACKFRQPNTDVLDVGSSRGDSVARLVDKFGAGNRFVCVEVSEPMLDVLRSRFAGMIRAGIVDVRADDLRREFPPVRASVVLSILTLQFIPINYRRNVLAAAYDHLAPGGALILVEKVLCATAKIDECFVDVYHSMKAANGYTGDEIERKRLSLEGVLVPASPAWNEEMLRTAGFSEVDCFWRWMNFAGWIAIKK